MNPDLAATAGGAFLLGAVTSIHCAAMCGPLACLACQHRGSCSTVDPTRNALHYHSARLASYTFIGLVAGALGRTAAALLPDQIPPWTGWALGAALILVALFGTQPGHFLRFLPKPHPALIGAATPLLPCGPLYLMFAFCALSGSPLRGASLALAFGLGTVPLLWLAQHGWGHLQRHFGTRGAVILHRIALVAAAGLVVWRLQTDGPPCCQASLP